MEYIKCSCRKTSECLTSTCERRNKGIHGTNGVHCTDFCRRRKNVEWNHKVFIAQMVVIAQIFAVGVKM